MKNKLLYFGLLVVTLYLAILYDSPMLLGLCLMEVVLPVVSVILLLWTAAHMKAQIYLPIGVAEKEQPVNVGVRIENKSRIPVSRLEAKIKIQNRFYQPEKEVTFQGMADGRGTTRLTTAITSSQCGPVALWVEQAKIWDLFHLFGKKIRVDGKEELSVLPEYYAAVVEITSQIREQLIDSEEYDEKRPGDDPSQIFQIREYREGDRMQRIHWKASARTSQIFGWRKMREWFFWIRQWNTDLLFCRVFWIRSIRRGRRGITAGHRVWNRWRSGSRKICIC